MKRSIRGWPRLRTGLKLLLAVVAGAWLLGSDRLHLASLGAANPKVLVLGVGPLVLLNLVAQGVRWYFLLQTQNLTVPLPRVLALAWIGNFFAIFSPGGVGGEVARGYMIWKDQSAGREVAVASVLADRALGLMVFFALSVTFFLLQVIEGEASPVVRRLGLASLAGLAIGLLTVILLWRAKRVPSFLPRLTHVGLGVSRTFLRNLVVQWKWTLGALALSIIAAVSLAAGFSLAALALHDPLPLARAIVAVPPLVVANSLPISPGGLGVGESVASILFQEMNRTDGAELMLLVRSAIYLLRFPGVFVLLLQKS